MPPSLGLLDGHVGDDEAALGLEPASPRRQQQQQQQQQHHHHHHHHHHHQELLWSPPWADASAEPAKAAPHAAARVCSWLCAPLRRAPRSLHATAYLDGLRGFAALLVYWHHHELWVHAPGRLDQNAVFENSFGYDGRFAFAALPGVRTLFAGGHYAVAVFFVLSGYVLALKPLRLIEGGDAPALADHLASALFRRWLRLFLPVAVVAATYAASWHLLGLWVSGAAPKGNLADELLFFYYEFKNFSFLFKEGGDPWLSYNFHVWSIPVEMRGSVVVYGTLLALSRSTLGARLWCQLGLIFYFLYIADGWYCAMFVAGMLLSHLDLLARLDRLPRFLARLGRYRAFIYGHLLVLSVYLGGVPSQTMDVALLARNRGWYYLSYLKPQAVFDYKWFYLFWAAVLLVASVPRIAWLRRFLETRACQHLGRISFALYLVHGPVLWTLGDRLYTAVGVTGPDQMQHIARWANLLPLPRAGPLGLEVCFLAVQLVLLPLTLAVADFATRAVDKPCVQFSQWLYRQTLPAPGGPEKQSQT